MKTLQNYHISISIVLLLISTNLLAQVVVNDTIPKTQSISNQVIVPRILTAQRIAIESPVTGMLVFDTDTQSLWFYSSSWIELATSTTDKIDKDTIRFTTDGTERMTIDNIGNTRIGDGTNNTYIESDGSLSYEGTATRWDDLRVPLSSTRLGGAEDPTFEVFKNDGEGSSGVYAARFKANTEEDVFFAVQMPHAWVEGTDIYPHIHWSPKDNTEGGKVRWGFEFIWVNVTGTFGNTTILYAEDPIPPIGSSPTAYQHVITAFGAISGAEHNLSSMLICRAFRDGKHDNDTYKGYAYLLEFDFHYQIDASGSREQFVK